MPAICFDRHFRLSVESQVRGK